MYKRAIAPLTLTLLIFFGLGAWIVSAQEDTENSLITFVQRQDFTNYLYVSNASGTDLRALLYGSAGFYFPALSPDGSKIVFASDFSINSANLYMIDIDGTNLVQLTSTQGANLMPSWSPDGSQILFASTRDGNANNNAEIYIMNADGSNQRRLTSNAGDNQDPTWSPDGERILFSSNRDGNYTLYKMNTDGTNVQLVMKHPPGVNVAGEGVYSPDGSQIAFLYYYGADLTPQINIMDADGNNQRRLTTELFIDDAPTWSPDGSQILFVRNDRSGAGTQLYSVDVDGSNLGIYLNLGGVMMPDWRVVPEDILFVTNANPTPSTTQALGLSATLSLGFVEPTTLIDHPTNWSLQATQLAGFVNNDLAVIILPSDFGFPTFYGPVAYRPDALNEMATEALFATSFDIRFTYIVEREGIVDIGGREAYYHDLVVAGQNQQMQRGAFITIPLTETSGIYLYGLSYSASAQPILDTLLAMAQSVRLEGEAIVLPSDVSSEVVATSTEPTDATIIPTDLPLIAFFKGTFMDGKTLYIADPDGSNQRALTDVFDFAGGLAWSPDGSQIAFSAAVEGRSQIMIINPNGADLRQITNCQQGCSSPTWSPDGSRIAFSHVKLDGVAGQIAQIYVMNADGSDMQPVTESPGDFITFVDVQPSWSPIDDRIVFIRGSGSLSELHTINVDGSNMQVITQNQRMTLLSSPGWTPDGSRIAFIWSIDGRSRVYSIASGGGNARAHTDNNSVSVFLSPVAPENTVITYLTYSTGNEQSGIYRVDLNTNNHTFLFTNLADDNDSGIFYTRPVQSASTTASTTTSSTTTSMQVSANFDLNCEVSARNNVNKRAGAGTNFAQVGQLQAGTSQQGILQALGSDNFIWYQLADETWVRSDLIQVTLDCYRLMRAGEEGRVLLVPDNRTVVPAGAVLLQNGIGRTSGARQNNGQVQVEYFCGLRGQGITNDNDNWYCTQGNDRVYTLLPTDFDAICQHTYSTPFTFAVQGGDSDVPAYRWLCYEIP